MNLSYRLRLLIVLLIIGVLAGGGLSLKNYWSLILLAYTVLTEQMPSMKQPLFPFSTGPTPLASNVIPMKQKFIKKVAIRPSQGPGC